MRMLDWNFNGRLVDAHGLPAVISAVGYIPSFVSADDPRPAWEQFDERYVFGGWNPALPGKWKLMADDYLHFPGDPPLEPIAMAFIREEKIIIYPHAWVAIVQPNGDFSVARLD